MAQQQQTRSERSVATQATTPSLDLHALSTPQNHAAASTRNSVQAKTSPLHNRDASQSAEYHRIKSGDTISTIAPRYGLTTEALLKANPGLDPKRLQIGAAVMLPTSQNKHAPAVQANNTHASQPTSKVNHLTPTQTHQAAQPIGIKGEVPRAAPTLIFAPPAPFYSSIIQTLTNEGGLTTNPNDRAHQNGVAMTNLGITGMAMREYIQKTEHRTASNGELVDKISKLSTEEAVQIYAKGYWRNEFQALGPKLSFLVFDWGVTSGPTTPIRQFQAHLGLPVTGAIDSLLLKRVSTMGEDAACKSLTECRKDFYTRLADKRSSDKGFLPGWLARCEAAEGYALSKRHEALTGVFERTSKTGCDLLDPIAYGAITLKKGTPERSLTRLVQERLNEAGYKLKQDGLWGSEMDKAVQNFKTRHNIPGKAEFGAAECAVLTAMQGKGATGFFASN